MPALVAGIHVFRASSKTWMAGTSPAMTWIDRAWNLLLELQVGGLDHRDVGLDVGVDHLAELVGRGSARIDRHAAQLAAHVGIADRARERCLNLVGDRCRGRGR